jgi:uncharacterized repeat protein (TIGR01451 family)
VSCPATPSGLAPDASITCTASYVTTHADWMAGSVTNTAQAHVGGFSSNTDSAKAVSTNGPALKLVKTTTTPTYAAVGDRVLFQIVLTNVGNVTVTDPAVVDTLVSDLDCGTVPSSLAPGASITCTASHTITDADMTAGHVINTATGHAIFNNAAVNADPATVVVTNSAKPVLTITANNQTRDFGKANPVLTYKITGFKPGDNAANSLTTDPTCVTIAKVSSLPGKYPITCSGAASSKYTIVYVPGTLTVHNAVGGATATPVRSATPAPTSTSGDSSNDTPPAPLLVLICLAFGGLGLLAVQAQRRTMRR